MSRKLVLDQHLFADSIGMPGYENLSDLALHLATVRAERVLEGGWGHGKKYKAIPLDAPIPWDEVSGDTRSWNFHVHCWDMVSDLLMAHSVTGEERYFAPALAIALSWVRRHEAPDADTSPFAWYDMAVGLRAHRLAYVVDFVRRSGRAGKAEQDLLWESLLRHRDFLADDANIVFHNNHGFYQVAGQLAMARRFHAEDAGMAAARQQGEQRLSRMIEQQFTPEGVHREHSPDYHRMVYDSLKGIIAAGLVDDPAIGEISDRIERSLAWFVTPDGNLVNFGDTDIRTVNRDAREADRRWRTDEMKFMASWGRRGKPPVPTVMAFEDSGYFVARERWPTGPKDFISGGYLAQTAAFHSRTHRHADDLSFVLFERGRPVLVDAGRFGYLGKAEPGTALFEDGYWYDHPKRVYVESTRAHNTVEIDGINHRRKGVRPYGSAIKRSGLTASGVAFCETEVKHHRSIRHARLLAYVPGRWLLVFDWLHDNVDKTHDFRQWFHFHPDLAVEVEPGGASCVVKERRKRFMRVLPLLGAPSIELVKGQTEPGLQGFYAPVDMAFEPNHALALGLHGQRSGCMATLFTLDPDVEPGSAANRANVSGRNVELSWQGADGRSRLRIARPADGDIQIDFDRQPLA